MMTNTHQNYPLLQPYKEKSECRIFFEDFLNIAVPFTLVVGGLVLIAFLVSIL